MYELVFPIYVSLLLHPNNYGSVVGFAVLSLTFFYYLAFIVLLGAEVNALAIGLHPTTKSLSAMLQELQAHDEMIEPPPRTPNRSGKLRQKRTQQTDPAGMLLRESRANHEPGQIWVLDRK